MVIQGLGWQDNVLCGFSTGKNMLVVSSAAWNGLRETVECMLGSQTFGSS